MNNILNINNLNYVINNNVLFNNINISIKDNSYTGIVLKNNSGKTILTKILSGNIPTKNNVSINKSYIDINRKYDYIKDLGVVFGEKLNMFLFDTVYKEMAFSLENLNYTKEKIEDRIIYLSKYFNISYLLDKKIIDLTNSEKQQLLLVISLLHEPKILILDDPFTMMDLKIKTLMKKKLKKYKDENKLTIIILTSNLDDILDTEYLYIINNKSIALSGSTLDVLKEDKIIDRLSFQIPFIVDLSLKLMYYNLIDHIYINIEELVNDLWK